MLPGASQLHGVRVFACPADGPLVLTERDAADIVGDALGERAELIVIPAERFDDSFFDLKTRIAGEVLQKFVTYHRRVAVIGDISRYIAQSNSLRDFVYETNRGDEIWFLPTVAELEARLGQEPAPKS
jgi:hypothetical protein